MSKKILMPIGSTYGLWTVISEQKGKKILCKCECGKEKWVDTWTLRNGKTRSCKCTARAKNIKAAIGKKNQWLECIDTLFFDREHFLLCVCNCGQLVKIKLMAFETGRTKSCGCWRTSIDRKLQNFQTCFTKSQGCWIWLGHIHPSGYGKHGNRLAHRLSYELYVEPIPDGKYILHSCDNKLCVNPSHLRPGCHQENMKDMTQRNRQAKGEKSGQAKLTQKCVKEIRIRYKNGETIAALSKKFGVTGTAIRYILDRKNWKHVK